MQVVLESPRDGSRYLFELNDRLIRDKELDGLTEIPVKPNTVTEQLQACDDEADMLRESELSALQGESCLLYFI